MSSGVAREMGADCITAVDLCPRRTLKRRPANPIETGIAAASLLQSRATLPDPRLVNGVIRPDVEEYAPDALARLWKRKPVAEPPRRSSARSRQTAGASG